MSNKFKEQLKEIALIAAIISDQFAKEIYDHHSTYMETLDIISDAAVECYEKYPPDETDWEEFKEKNEFAENGCDWDEFITHWAYHQLIKIDAIPSDTPNPAEMNFTEG